MDTKLTKLKPLIGIDQRLVPSEGSAYEIVNFRQHEQLGFINDVGWEPLIKYDTASPSQFSFANYEEFWRPVRFLAVWGRHQDSESYYLYERNGSLQYDWGNRGAATDRNIILEENRYLPKPDDPGTQIAPFGRFALILNGINRPIKFWGRRQVEQFSWTLKPGQPTVLTPQPSATDASLPEYVDGGKCHIRFSSTAYHGLGGGTNGSVNNYSWRVAWISNTGSVSPPSDPVFSSWEIDQTDREGKYSVMLLDLPIGPEGTVGRIIYRTKNKIGTTAQGDTFYEVARIMENVSTSFIDFYPDSELDTVALDLLDSTTISHGHKYATAFDGCMWLAGGEAEPTKVVYSKPGLPEQFPAANYFDVGVRQGGHITGLIPFYNSLLVFRERAIDIITKANTGYLIATLDPFVGTTASNTIRFVPEVGVCFLTKEGVFAVTGGIFGGSEHKAKNISEGLCDEWSRLSFAALPRATAAYSPKEKEYWVHYPADGRTENTRGAVLHVAKEIGWTLRNCENDARGDMRFTHIAVDPAGWFILGTKPKYTIDPANSNSFPGIGLQVWSHSPYWGQCYTYDSTGQAAYTFILTDEPKAVSKLISIWDDLGDHSTKKSISHVIIDGLSQGNNILPLSWAIDHGYTFIGSRGIAPQQPEYYNTQASQTILSMATTRPLAGWNITAWEKSKRIPIRFDVGAQQCSTFRWKIETVNYIHILGYVLAYNTIGMKSTYMGG